MTARQFRQPLAGALTSRIATSAVIGAASGVWGTGVWGAFVWGGTGTGTQKDQQFVNCFGESISDPMGGAKRIYNVKRPGAATHTTPQAGSIGNQILVWTGLSPGTKIISAFGATNSSIYDGAGQLATNNADTTVITGLATGITETDLSGTATLVISSTDNTAWSYTNGGTVTKIADADFPGNAALTLAGTFAHMDGYACIMTTTGRLYASDLNSITAWTSTSFDTCNAYPDAGVGVVRYKNLLMAFGTESVQFWFNAGLTPFPFAKNVSMTLKVGAVAAKAITQISDTTFWAGSTPQGGISIFQFDGNLTRVSPPELDALFVLAGASGMALTSARFYGRSFVVVTAGTATFVYCVEEKTWHLWISSVQWWYKMVGLSVGANIINYAISTTLTSGKVYKVDPAALVFTDDGTTYSRLIQLAPMDHGTKRMKFWNSVELVGDQETSAALVTLAYSDDDGQTYTTWGTVDMSSARPIAFRLGASRRRLWALSESIASPMRLEVLEGQVEIGSS